MKRCELVGLCSCALLLACSDSSQGGPDTNVSLDADVGVDVASADVDVVDAGVPDLSPDGASSRFDPQVEQALQKALSDYWTKHQPPAVVAAVQRGPQMWRGAIGEANIAQSSDMTVDHSFRIASVTKTFVATLILALEEDNKLSIEDKLSQWVPSFPNGDNIPLYRLLNHTSGIANFGDCPAQPSTPQDLVQLAIGTGPTFEPGAGWDYSGTNYILLAMIIEKATGKEWHLSLREKILDPHGLTHTYVADLEPASGATCSGYELQSGILTEITDGPCSGAHAASGMVSTVADLTRFYTMLLDGAIISLASLKKMSEDFTVEIPAGHWFYTGSPEGAVLSYGLGITVSVANAQRYYGHGGRMPGYNTFVSARESDGLIVAAAINASELWAIILANDLWAATP